jgi:murein DD-endopeptidase MepM/ murein hydrolase activator NlpD
VVRSAGWEAGYGHTIEIDHGYGIVTRFAHASRLLVRKGERVSRGEKIALVGNSGLATGPHLHYEVHVGGRPVNPLRYVMPETVVFD